MTYDEMQVMIERCQTAQRIFEKAARHCVKYSALILGKASQQFVRDVASATTTLDYVQRPPG